MSLTLVVGLLLIGFGIRAMYAQEAPRSIKMVPVHSTNTISGKELYREYCAVCHGAMGKGDGPAAAALKTPPADLTRITAHSAGKFDEIRVQHMIGGETEPYPAHGSREMPIWGNIFRHMGNNQDIGTVRVYNLVKYLQDIQAK